MLTQQLEACIWGRDVRGSQCGIFSTASIYILFKRR